jgi:serine/threonine protein kinase
MKKIKFKKGLKLGKWILVDPINSGGNGEVWICRHESENELRAIKILKSINFRAYERFKDEIFILETNSDIQGLIPLEEKYVPQAIKKNELPYYIMPIAQKSENILNLQSIESKVKAILEIAETLEKLHKREISHRDIKPANILYYNAKFILADFGLVDFPDKNDISKTNENIGAKWTIAPEMRRDSSTADGFKADVYSLAKTLWMFLTNNYKGFDGQYTTDSIIELRKYNRNAFTSTIDNLLFRCTDNDPHRRPDITDFIVSLKEWQTLAASFHESKRREWFDIQTKLFPTSIPERVIWNNREDILKVLKVLCSTENLHHVFFPISGGLDLIDVRLSVEKECLELDFVVIEIIKPKRLIFESFGSNPEWNYFRLELDELEPTKFSETTENVYLRITENYEDITELAPGIYYPYSVLSQDRKDFLVTRYGRRVRRRFRGNYVIFGKRSTYNLTSSTYDGRHDKLTTDEFRNIIKKTVDKIKQDKKNNLISQSENSNQATGKRFLLVEQPIHRCGGCGNIVDSDGNELNDHDRDYNLAVLKRFGSNLSKEVEGYCCRERSKNL